MRRVEVTCPQGKLEQVAQLAFSCGIPQISVVDKKVHKPGAAPEVKHYVDMDVPTPEAKAFTGETSP